MSHKELHTESLHIQLREIHRLMDINKARGRGMLDRWAGYGTDIEDYQETFSEVLGGMSIVDFIRSRRSPVVIDLMAPSQTLVSLFEHTPKPELGLAVSLEDLRGNGEKRRDRQLNVHQLAGDITQSSTWKMIDRN